ncbi:MAG: hypothetical protein KDE55_08075 [Novosphingobium sp.]|nr:hypothetical protein [Novosphingobium sp.]
MFGKVIRTILKIDTDEPLPEPVLTEKQWAMLRRAAMSSDGNPLGLATNLSDDDLPPLPYLDFSTGGSPDEMRRLLSEIYSLQNEPLRDFLHWRYRNDTGDTEEVERRTRDVCDAAFGADALAVSLELLVRAPSRLRLTQTFSADEFDRLGETFDTLLDMGRERAMAQNFGELPVGQSLLPQVVSTMGRIGSLGVLDADEGIGRWYEPVLRAAVQKGDMRDQLTSMFSMFFAAGAGRHDEALALSERLLPQVLMNRREVPQIVEFEEWVGRLDRIRDTIFMEVGQPLAPAMRGILDHEIEAETMSQFQEYPEIKALVDLDPETRGSVFQHLIDCITDLRRHGVSAWGELERHDGKYRRAREYDPYPAGFAAMFGVLAMRKIDLPDPDNDMARFLHLVPHFPLLAYKKILNLALRIAKRSPTGRTADVLRSVVQDASPDHPFFEWLDDIEAALCNRSDADEDAEEDEDAAVGV